MEIRKTLRLLLKRGEGYNLKFLKKKDQNEAKFIIFKISR